MPRYRLTVEYDGAPFVGWQRQDNGPSVQGALEEAIFKLCGETVTVTGAGRTDAGVHAYGQVAHFDLVKAFAPDKIRDALNHFLRPAPAAVLDAAVADPEFHARFSAKGRHYLYRIVCRRTLWPPQVLLQCSPFQSSKCGLPRGLELFFQAGLSIWLGLSILAI